MPACDPKPFCFLTSRLPRGATSGDLSLLLVLWPQTLFGATLYKEGAGEVGTKACLKGKEHVAIFFGAAWSGSCKQFLAPLVQVCLPTSSPTLAPLPLAIYYAMP